MTFPLTPLWRWTVVAALALIVAFLADWATRYGIDYSDWSRTTIAAIHYTANAGLVVAGVGVVAALGRVFASR